MNVAIGGYLLMAVMGSGPTTIDIAVKTGEVVKAFDSADDCEAGKHEILAKSRQALVCIPALAVINR